MLMVACQVEIVAPQGRGLRGAECHIMWPVGSAS